MNIVEKIQKLKKEKKAIILVHNYQLPEIQDLADFVGDSLGLSLAASRTDAKIIVFCGVYFMAETAKILSPEKTVLIPESRAGCPMAEMIDAGELRNFKKEHPSAKVLSYVNTSAEVKAESDLCCTSANVIKMVEKVLGNEKEIIFVPDKYLAAYVEEKTGRKFIKWNGYCPTHVKILPEFIVRQKKLSPQAEVLVHPECVPAVIKLADGVFSTEGMVKYVKQSKAAEFIIGTEIGLIHRLQKEAPAKKFYPASELATCPNMKLITLEKVLSALEEEKTEVTVPPAVAEGARKSIQKMLDFSD